MNPSVFNVLESIQEEVGDKISSLNYGGCGVFAALVGKELKKRGYTVYGVLYHPWFSESISINKIRASNSKLVTCTDWDRAGVELWHIQLMFHVGRERLLFDVNTLRTVRYKSQHQLARGIFTIEELDAMSRVEDGWNPRYDRKQNRLLEEIISKHMKLLDA